MIMPKHIQNIKQEELVEYFLKKNISKSSPVLLSIDCDRTLVDRNKGAHFVSDDVVSMFNDLRKESHFVVTINTGRDLTSYRPIQDKLSHTEPCLFLSGRVLHYSNQTITLPFSEIPHPFCTSVWNKIQKQEIAFIDTKHELGNTLFVLQGKIMKEYYGLYKPLDWFDLVHPNEIVISRDTSADLFHQYKIVRMEIPFFKTDHEEIVEAIEENNREKVQQMISDFFGRENCELLRFIPARINSSWKTSKTGIAYVRVLVNPAYVNKGTGIKALMKQLSIPETNVMCFGDSSAETASDSIIKQILPKATLFLVEDGDTQACQDADFLIQSVGNNGVPEIIARLVNVFKKLT